MTVGHLSPAGDLDRTVPTLPIEGRPPHPRVSDPSPRVGRATAARRPCVFILPRRWRHGQARRLNSDDGHAPSWPPPSPRVRAGRLHPLAYIGTYCEELARERGQRPLSTRRLAVSMDMSKSTVHRVLKKGRQPEPTSALAYELLVPHRTVPPRRPWIAEVGPTSSTVTVHGVPWLSPSIW